MSSQSSSKHASIGSFPAGWKITRLGDESVAEIIMGQSPPSKTYNEERIGLPFFQGKAEFGEIYPSPEIYCSDPLRIAEKNDILLSVRAPVGDVNMAPSRCCIGRGLSAIRAKEGKIHPWFLFYYLKFDRRRFESLGMGSTFKAIRKGEVERFQIPVPPYQEQAKIAGVLGCVDDAIRLVDLAIAGTERSKKGLMQKLLTEGIGHKEYKQTPIGKTPKTWEVLRLEDVIFEAKSGFASGKRDENGIIQLRMDSIDTQGWINRDAYVKVPIPDNVEDYILKNRDVIFNNTNSADLIGKTAIFREEFSRCVYSNHLTRIRSNPNKVIPEWILFVFIRNWADGIFKAIRHQHVHQAGINQGDLLNLRVPVPSLGEQRKIVEVFDAVDESLRLNQKRKRKLERVKEGLMNDLLTGRRRVKVAM